MEHQGYPVTSRQGVCIEKESVYLSYWIVDTPVQLAPSDAEYQWTAIVETQSSWCG